MGIQTEQEQPHEPMISQAKAAEICGMTRADIRKLVRSGQLRSLEIGGTDLVFLKEVEVFEAAQAKDKGAT